MTRNLVLLAAILAAVVAATQDRVESAILLAFGVTIVSIVVYLDGGSQ